LGAARGALELELFPRCLSRSRHHSSLCIWLLLVVHWPMTYPSAGYPRSGSRLAVRQLSNVPVPCTVSLPSSPPSPPCEPSTRGRPIASLPLSWSAPQRANNEDVTVVSEPEHPCLPLVTFPCLAATIFLTSLVICVLTGFHRAATVLPPPTPSLDCALRTEHW
jgi:hypothetical protein